MDETVADQSADVYSEPAEPARPRILVTGSRGLDVRHHSHPSADLRHRCDLAQRTFIAALEDAVMELAFTGVSVRPIVIVHGGAKYGADNWAQRWVFEAWDSGKISRGLLHSERHVADWDRYGKAAGMVRNGVMIDSMSPDEPHLVLACWDGRSPGTKNTIDRALVKGLRVQRCHS